MATTANLNNQGETIDTTNDCIVVRNYIDGIPGGKTLDVTGFTPSVIKSGHIIIKEDATGVHKPMPLAEGGATYAALPSGHSYVGVLAASILTSKPFAAIMLRGVINEVASPFALISGMKTALPHIIFTQD